MSVIAVVNPKGGVGKSTLATNLAGYLAACGHAVMLGDIDRQQASRTWLSLRSTKLAPIRAWQVVHDEIVCPPKGTTHVVLDTPAGLSGKHLDDVMKVAAKVLIPLQPSIFDIHATRDFLQLLLHHPSSDRVSMAIVGIRIREGTLSSKHLRQFLETAELPTLGFLRDSQNYVHLAAQGLTLWDAAPSRVARDLEQWRPILKWLVA